VSLYHSLSCSLYYLALVSLIHSFIHSLNPGFISSNSDLHDAITAEGEENVFSPITFSFPPVIKKSLLHKAAPEPPDKFKIPEYPRPELITIELQNGVFLARVDKAVKDVRAAIESNPADVLALLLLREQLYELEWQARMVRLFLEFPELSLTQLEAKNWWSHFKKDWVSKDGILLKFKIRGGGALKEKVSVTKKDHRNVMVKRINIHREGKTYSFKSMATRVKLLADGDVPTRFGMHVSHLGSAWGSFKNIMYEDAATNLRVRNCHQRVGLHECKCGLDPKCIFPCPDAESAFFVDGCGDPYDGEDVYDGADSCDGEDSYDGKDDEGGEDDETCITSSIESLSLGQA
jgi:hypothetical protein